MYVQVKQSSGITTVPIESRLFASRKIFIEGAITPETAVEFTKQVTYLGMEDATAPIDMYINTPGGEINSGLLMYDIIQTSGLMFRSYCIGRCFSMGAVLLACANAGRYILPHGEVMIHEPALNGSLGGSSSTIHSIAESLLATQRKMNEILSRHSKMTVEEVAKETRYDHYLTAEEAIALGLCDEIRTFGQFME
ncbi:MAG: ATP-dependent Clp protease proteolytic subunit [Blautia sp.]|nr:ATP-dependent Clp protease proteolytic subunit [Blautia sp.]